MRIKLGPGSSNWTDIVCRHAGREQTMELNQVNAAYDKSDELYRRCEQLFCVEVRQHRRISNRQSKYCCLTSKTKINFRRGV